MKTLKCDKIKIKIKLMQYHDRELAAEDHVSVKKHLETCPVCHEYLRKLGAVSDLFNIGFQPDRERAARRWKQRRNRSDSPLTSVWKRIIDYFRIKRVFIPACAMAAALIVIFSFDGSVRQPETIIGPSAIIRSFSGDVAAVMFLETPESHQTIIWYQE